MLPTLAVDDRTVIPIYTGIQVYCTSKYEHTTRNIWRWTHEHDLNL